LEVVMAERWDTFDRMLRDLGAVRSQIDTLSGTPSEQTAEAEALRSALNRATDAVHHCLDEESERAFMAAWQAIAQAQDALRHAESVIVTARNARLLSREIRSRAATQREAARLWRRSHGHDGPPPDGARPADGEAEDDPSEGDES
jgi:chromosome segregation ATPase